MFIVVSSAVMVIIVAFGLKIWEGLLGGGDLDYFETSISQWLMKIQK